MMSSITCALFFDVLIPYLGNKNVNFYNKLLKFSQAHSFRLLLSFSWL